jgi:hypothetical protein
MINFGEEWTQVKNLPGDGAVFPKRWRTADYDLRIKNQTKKR